MTEINDKMTTESPPGTSPTRTQQALDQAAGGSGDIALERTEQDDTAGFRPQHGTDDARCEDSGEADRQRKRTVEDVMSKIANAGTTSSAEKAGEDPLDDGDTSDQGITDAAIRAEIARRLEEDDLLDAANIFVIVSHGRVIIEGTVENHEAKQRAEAISRQANGITAHDANLAVRRSQ